jgi:hypothetical protein
MKIRMHRSSLQEALATIEEIEPTLEAVRAHVEAHGGVPILPAAIVRVERYGYDPRIDWDTHLVMYGKWPVAFTDGPVLV